MMIMESGPTPCYPNGYGVSDQQMISSSSSLDADSSSSTTNPASFLYNLSVLKDKVHQVQSLATIFFSPDHPESTAIAIPTMGTLIQEIIVTASTMMFACQQMSLCSPPTNPAVMEAAPSSSFFNNTADHWFIDGTATTAVGNCTESVCEKVLSTKTETNEESHGVSLSSYDIVELDAADILAKYTHYCHVCGKGFKRDANLRMHMRAHGDEYKSSAALSNPLKNGGGGGSGEARVPRKYSCPQEGCRWNKKHVKFQPLKSMICVKNHYKRSHCPKMYVCKRCTRKQFSVLSDLRTHEKHCGDLKWQCSCGTTFSRKDKLMGHVALFIGHKPAVNSSTKMGNGVQNTGLNQLDDAR